MELEPIIGLEIHVQLTTQSKMFCSCANIFGDIEPNTAICPICLGYPGTLPVPNKQAIDWIQKVGAALDCELALSSRFDRKHYFYPDLPKGYQISQFDKPFCGKGKLTIIVNGEEKTIGITRIHLEEDAAKNTHPANANYTLVDYNRAGTPLIEIVTEPDIKNPDEARIFLQELQRIIRTLEVSTADMEKGQMRCDANISLRPKGEEKFYPKTEVKNINSHKFVEKALAYEIERQTKAWEKKEIPKHATRGWDLDTGKTTLQRTKEEAADYRYFPEPDIPPFEFTQEELENIKKGLPELPNVKKQRLIKQTGINEEHAQLLVADNSLAQLFEDAISELDELEGEDKSVTEKDKPALVRSLSNIIVREVRQLFTQKELTYPSSTTKISGKQIAELALLLHAQTINQSAIALIVEEMQKTGGDPHPIIQKLGLEQEKNSDKLSDWADEVIEANPDVVEKIKAGKEAAIQFLMGQVMGKSKGKANPKQIIELLRKKILS